MIILVSDGFSYDLGNGRALEVATRLAKEKIVVYIIQVADEPLPDEMHTIASLTNGETFTAGDPAALSAVFKHIDQMRAARLKPPTRDFADLFAPIALAGLIVTGLHLLALFGLRYTPW